ncbi:unnamed protein product [Colias eurytheme]|nr:unnamed protein product [Colias eurytheme]
MPARRKLSPRQVEILVEFAEFHREIALGRFSGGSLANQATRKAWEEVAVKLNSVAEGSTKTPDQWRRLTAEEQNPSQVVIEELGTQPSTSTAQSSFEPSMEIEWLEDSPPLELQIPPGTSHPDTHSVKHDNKELSVEKQQTICQKAPKRKTKKRISQDERVPHWAYELERKRLAVEERHTAAIEKLAVDNCTEDKEEGCNTENDKKQFKQIGSSKSMAKENTKLKKAEAAICSYIVENNLPISSVEPLIKLIKSLPEKAITSQISLAKQKATNVIRNGLRPFFNNKLIDELKHHLFSVYIDETTDVSVTKQLAILVSYCHNFVTKVDVIDVRPFSITYLRLQIDRYPRLTSTINKAAPMTKDETMLLVQLVAASAVINNKATNATNNKMKDQAWQTLAVDFNSSVSNSRRTPAQLRLKWENLKKAARKRCANMRISHNKTGGGKDYFPPDEVLDKVTSLLGSTCQGFSVEFGGDATIQTDSNLVMGEVENVEVINLIVNSDGQGAGGDGKTFSVIELAADRASGSGTLAKRKQKMEEEKYKARIYRENALADLERCQSLALSTKPGVS